MRSFLRVNGGMRYLAKQIGTLPAKAAAVPIAMAKATAPVLSLNTKAMYGQNPPLADLKDSTQADRVQQGYSANDPLVRSGELRSKEEFAAVGPIAGAGNPDPRSGWMESGRPGMEPRPVHLYGLDATEPFVKLEAVRAMRRVLE